MDVRERHLIDCEDNIYLREEEGEGKETKRDEEYNS